MIHRAPVAGNADMTFPYSATASGTILSTLSLSPVEGPRSMMVHDHDPAVRHRKLSWRFTNCIDNHQGCPP